MQVLTHPDNVAALRAAIEEGRVLNAGPALGSLWPDVVTVRGVEMMEKDKPTGRFILRDGSVVEKSDIAIRERFVTYGPEDVDWLLFAGVIREQREMNIVLMNDSLFRVRAWDMPMVMDSRRVMITGAC